MRKFMAVFAAVLILGSGFANGEWPQIAQTWHEIQNGAIPYTNPATNTLDIRPGSFYATNLTATALATPGAITVTPVLTKIGSITTVAGSALVDGDAFTIKYAPGLTVPCEFDLSPGDGTTGGAIPILFTAGDSADQIRDGLITLLNAAAGTALTASSGGAATVSLVLDTPGAAGDTNTEAVANAGFAVTGFADPTHVTTYTYKIVDKLASGYTTEAGPASSTAVGHATLSTANRNDLTFPALPAGVASRDLYRTVGGATQGLIWSGTALSVSDTGLAGGGETAPTVNGTGVLTGRGVLADGTTVARGAGGATARVGGVLAVWTGSATTTGTVEQVLSTYTLPANTLARDGQVLRITVWGTHAANANSASLRVLMGGIGSTIIASRSSTTSAAVYLFTALLVRTGAATQVSIADQAAVTALSISSAAHTATLANANDITFTGLTSTAAGDVTLEGYVIEALN